MHNVRQRLYKTKVALLAIVFTIVGLALIVGAAWLGQTSGWQWIQDWPLKDIGLALFTTGLVVVAFTYIDGADKEERDAERIGHAVEDKAPAIVQAVLDGLTASSDNMKLLGSDQQDQLIRNGLAARLGDADFATEVYDDIRDQAIRAEERWHRAKVSIRLSPLSMERAATSGGSSELFGVTVRCEYAVVPKYQTRQFVCVSKKQEYRELTAEPSNTSAWYLKPAPGVDASSKDAFELVQFSVDGEDRPIRRSTRSGGQLYSVDLGIQVREPEQTVAISYTYRTVTAADGHLLYFDVEQPTKGIEVELDYGTTSIDTVSVLEFIASSRKSRIIRTPAELPGRSVRVEFDGWVFPRSGVAFVWTS